MENMQIFSCKEFGQVRTVSRASGIWFVGKDLCKSLGYTNSRKAIGDHVDSEDKGVTICDTQGGKQKLAIINESGMYALIFGSKLESAKKFKRWVTSEVLPSIRKTGAYSKECIQLTEAHNKALDYILKSTSDKLPYVASILADAGFNIPTVQQEELYEIEFIKALDVVGRFTDDVYNEYKDLYKGEKLSKTLFSRKVNALHGTITKTKKDGLATRRVYEIR